MVRDIVVTYIRASGPGGQHRNKRETGVRIVHVPTGITVTATERRERPQNLALALERLERKLEERTRKPKPRKKTRPTRASIERRLEAKRRRAKTKKRRQSDGED